MKNKTKIDHQYESFHRRIPFKLIPTNIQGVFTSPGFPEELDPNTASSTTMIKHGLLWSRPSEVNHPGIEVFWKKVFSRKWQEKDRVYPHLVPQPGKTHILRENEKKTDSSFNSNNWSGASIKGNWMSCVGSWSIPTVSQPPEKQGVEGGWNSSSWLGIDGAYGSNDVLQAGIEQRVDSSGNPLYNAWFEWFVPNNPSGTINEISRNKVILEDTSPVSPSITSFYGNIYISWKGDGNDNINVMVSTDNGVTFGKKYISTESSDDTPVLVAGDNNLYIAWKGSSNDNLNVAIVDIDKQTGAPTGFSNKIILEDTSPVRPALAFLDGSLYLAWKGDGNDNLNVMVSEDNGRTFGNKYISSETSPEAPTLCVNNGSLFIGWKGDGNDNLNVAVVNIEETGIPSGFSNKVILGDTSPIGPALVSLNGYLFLGWKGDGNDNLNIIPSMDNGQSFGNKFISPETSSDSPSLTTHNGNLYITWKGSGNDNLNVSRVDVSGFTIPPYVNQVNIPNFPVKPGDTVYCSVQYISNRTAGLIHFANNTTGEHFSVTLVPPPGATFNGASIEWIMEAPDNGLPNSSLPKFTPVHFTGAYGCGPGTVGDPKNADIWNIVDNSVNPPKTLTNVALSSDSVTINFIG
ncbi:G1 family endopeptidase (plasmid) [Bacillus cereus]|uniref:G1 family glutamic endopeptidase n=1 Tax=Bacillus cereus TaxID=1396 RepID=UPI0021CB5D0A|nr:G1 family glutamic endopeptidase [Bacillus cereus]MCU7756879.1 G1 family endopeptidase [Bacillus cereus]MDC7752518.1 G1 family endopeptidase [Bacillus cereus]UXP17361.1 G1 family endopeptidase [Bacillus cereus]